MSGTKANQTSFKKGYDAKRYVPVNEGLVQYHKRLGELLRDRSLDAVDFILDTMNNEKASLKLRVSCANDVLDRGLGRAVDRTVVAMLDSGTGKDAARLTTSELEAIISKLDDNSGIIEADYEEVPFIKG
jgi:hypothetical protein